MHNIKYQDLLNINYHKSLILYIFIVSIVSLLLYSNFKYVYSTYELTGIAKNNEIIINLPIADSDTFKKGEYITINGEIYSYYVISYGENIIAETESQIVTIKTTNIIKDNEITNIVMYYDYEKLINKIINYII